MTGADWLLLAVPGMGGLIGLRRGAVAGGLDLIALALGFAAAIFATPWIDERLVGAGIGQRWLLIGLAVGVFGAVAGVSGLILRLVAAPLGLATKVPPFGLLDSLLGIGPGLVKGGLVSVVIVLVVVIQFPGSAAAKRIRDSEAGEIFARAGSEGYAWAGDRAGVDLHGLTLRRVDAGQTWATPVTLPDGRLEPDTAAEREVLRLMNTARAAAGVPSLDADGNLARIARDHAADARVGDARGLPASAADIGDRLARAGVTCLAVGAVLGAGDSVEGIVADMLRSPAHRDVVLSRTYFWAGFGVMIGDNGEAVLVGVFTV